MTISRFESDSAHFAGYRVCVLGVLFGVVIANSGLDALFLTLALAPIKPLPYPKTRMAHR